MKGKDWQESYDFSVCLVHSSRSWCMLAVCKLAMKSMRRAPALGQGPSHTACGPAELKIIAAILERPVIEKILAHLGLDPQPPPKGRAREVGLHFAA